MASPTVTAEPRGYVPNTTLGRTGFIQGDEDAIEELASELDALLCVITADDGSEEPDGFRNCNLEIQSAVLRLAARLAHDVHELAVKRQYRHIEALQASQGAA